MNSPGSQEVLSKAPFPKRRKYANLQATSHFSFLIERPLFTPDYHARYRLLKMSTKKQTKKDPTRPTLLCTTSVCVSVFAYETSLNAGGARPYTNYFRPASCLSYCDIPKTVIRWPSRTVGRLHKRISALLQRPDTDRPVSHGVWARARAPVVTNCSI